MTKLPRKVEGDSLGAKHVNQLSEAAEKFMSMQRTNNAGLAPFVQQQCEVVAIGCNGVDDTGTEDDSDFDPAQADLYTIRVYFWNSTAGNWVRDDQGAGYCLDDKLVQTGYEVGSKLVAYFDPQRNTYIPLTTTIKHKQVILDEDLYAGVAVKTDPSFAAATVLVKRRGNLVDSGKKITVSNRFINISVDAGTYAKAEWIDGEWQLYAADCPGGSESSGSSGSGTGTDQESEGGPEPEPEGEGL
jgi:hypothetical protein